MFKKILLINLVVLFFAVCGFSETYYQLDNLPYRTARNDIHKIGTNQPYFAQTDFYICLINMHMEDGSCVCNDTFIKKDGFCVCPSNTEAIEGRCESNCPEGEELVGDKCYKLTPKACDEGYELDETDTCVRIDLTLDDCKDGQVFDSDQNKCVDMDLNDGEGGGGCSIGGNVANPLNLILLLSFLVPVFKRKK